jgi:hypothetical protein
MTFVTPGDLKGSSLTIASCDANALTGPARNSYPSPSRPDIRQLRLFFLTKWSFGASSPRARGSATPARWPERPQFQTSVGILHWPVNKTSAPPESALNNQTEPFLPLAACRPVRRNGAVSLQAELIDVIDHLPAYLVDRRTEFQLMQVKGRLENAIDKAAQMAVSAPHHLSSNESASSWLAE